EGQALLDQDGGRFARLGRVVRSCHERWDGSGYPDGLEGEEIPVVARIVFCCDAHSAMTTDRPYRRAMTPAAALDELSRGPARQFGVPPRPRWGSRTRSRACAWIHPRDAGTGAPAPTSFGGAGGARGMPIRWRWPPENSCGRRL